jgi:hypothetical protein
VIFPPGTTLKNSRPTSAPFFAGWLSRPVMVRRENNFWRFAESQCELGLQDLRTRITKRITRVAPGASSPDVHLSFPVEATVMRVLPLCFSVASISKCGTRKSFDSGIQNLPEFDQAVDFG